jgi:signal recognition particle GTPase
MAIIEGVIAGVAVQELIQQVARQMNTSDEEVREALKHGDIDSALQKYNQTDLEKVISGVNQQLLAKDVEPEKVTDVESRLRERSR